MKKQIRSLLSIVIRAIKIASFHGCSCKRNVKLSLFIFFFFDENKVQHEAEFTDHYQQRLVKIITATQHTCYCIQRV